MLLSTIILGWIGIVIFLVIIFTFRKMMKNNEYGFLHILMAIMYAMWFPLPIALLQKLDSDILLVGTIFGLAYLVLLVISMVFQTGHIVFITKQNEDQSISDKHGAYMMATLTRPFESFLGVFKSLWAIFLSITFWQTGEVGMACLMFLFGLLIVYYLFMVLDTSLVKRIKLFSIVKPNPFFVNLETLIFFIILMGYITF